MTTARDIALYEPLHFMARPWRYAKSWDHEDDYAPKHILPNSVTINTAVRNILAANGIPKNNLDHFFPPANFGLGWAEEKDGVVQPPHIKKEETQ